MLSAIGNTIQSGISAIRSGLEMAGEAHLARSRMQTEVIAPSVGKGIKKGVQDVVSGYTNDPLVSGFSKKAIALHGSYHGAKKAGAKGILRGAGQALFRSKFGGVGWAPDAIRFGRGFYQGFTSGLSKFGE